MPNPQNPQVVYLTFDDGPDPKWTPQVLEMLSCFNARATFFVTGQHAATHPDLIVEEANAGHTIGNHGYNHVKLTSLTFSDFRHEVKDTHNAIHAALCSHPELSKQVLWCLRPPYGSVNFRVLLNAYLVKFNIVMWDIGSKDYSGIPAEEIYQRIMTKLKPGSIISMHDAWNDKTETVRALGLILKEITSQGWEFRPLWTGNDMTSKKTYWLKQAIPFCIPRF